MPGISTTTIITSPITNRVGAIFCQTLIGTAKAASATSVPRPSANAWRTRKWVCL
jgi:hypothetical protein